jgi:hypothetical protein
MRIFRSSQPCQFAGRWCVLIYCLLASAAQAHPGHVHPDETDEFDLIRTLFFHSHGMFDYLLVAVMVGSVVVGGMHHRRSVRIGALTVAATSFALLPMI